MNNHTDRYFRDRLAGIEAPPDERVWAKISGQMARNRRKKTILLYFRIAAGMALLVSLGIGGFMMVYHAPKQGTLTKTIENEGAMGRVGEGAMGRRGEGKGEYSGNENDAVTAVMSQIVSTTLPPVSQASLPVMAIIPSLPSGQLASASLPFLPVVRKTLPEPVMVNLADLMVADETTEATPQHWLIGSEVAPLYSYRTIASDYLSQSSMKTMNSSEDGHFAFAGGISVGYATGRRLSVESGVYYSRYGQEKNKVEAYTAKYDNLNTGMATSSYLAIPNSTGQIETETMEQTGYDKVVSNTTGSTADLNNFSGFPGISTAYYSSQDITGLSATQYFDYLEVPLVLKYRIIDRKLGLSVTGGLVTNFLVNNGFTLHNDGKDENLGKTSGINTVNYLGSVGVGVDYPIMNRVAFSLTPRFRYYINPIDRSSQINVHPYSFGIFAGLCYTFK